eukprot:TRINITY_DN309_c0_g1_i2.p1 TRINITY_DN309_c0_g1~~TRINITY_DN309_c0_g1_i2.p1  ORF type:complete len:585 (-),score=135.53 TRINITY_DN309_c0_g1_i2:132-1886(-)
MLDNFSIFTRGGLILWTSQVAVLRGSPIEALIKTCLLEEKSGETFFQYGNESVSYTLKWTFHNDLGLVFVAVYQRILQLLYVDELLGLVSKEFASYYCKSRFQYEEFGPVFHRLVESAECNLQELKRPKQLKNKMQLKNDGAMSKGGATGKGSMASSSEGGEGRLGNAQKIMSGSEDEESKPKGLTTSSVVSAFDMGRLRQRKGCAKGGAGGRSDSMDSLDTFGKNLAVSAEKKVKQMRKWDDLPTSERLDYTDAASGGEDTAPLPIDSPVVGRSLMDDDRGEGLSEDEEMEEVLVGVAGAEGKKGWLSSIFKSVAGKSVLEEEDVAPALKGLKERLMSKNVAEEIAEKLCDSVASNLVGCKQTSFTRVSSTVKAAMEDALMHILTPRRSIDVLRDVQSAAEHGRPYVIVFIGVNGVGKSTNLAKVAYWLLQHGMKVMLAACDTFRSGAVEQLRTHGRRLQIPVFERGYEKDPAAVAKEAIREAARTNQDVVLVDTAGRMQDNEPLMRALAKLISINKPDLVLFVGEALVGNDAVDQLSKFNQVGAALSMVYTSGAPIMFVGCGQTYTDLKKLDVKLIVKTLLQ